MKEISRNRTAGSGTKGQAQESASFSRWLLEWALLILLAFIIAGAVKTFVVQPFVVPSGSMEPTIQIGDRVFANKFIYRFTSPKRGDIIVFEPWRAGQEDLIKRVIAVGGQTIAMRADGRFTIDGKPFDEPYLTPGNRITTPGRLLPYRVPRGYVFVMGDNRNNSGDSRFNGPVPMSRILGEAFVTYWPPTRIGTL